MHDAFFRQNFLIARGILVQKIITRALFFANLMTLKMVDDPNNQASLVRWLPLNPNAAELAVLRKVNLIFQWIG